MPVIRAKALALCVCPIVATPPMVLAVHPPARHAVARILYHAANRLDRKPDATPKVIATAPACAAPAGNGDGGPMVAAGGGGEAGAGADTGKMVTVAVSTQDGGGGAATIGDGGDPVTGRGGGFGGAAFGGGTFGGGQGGFASGGNAVAAAAARPASGAPAARDGNKALTTVGRRSTGAATAADPSGGRGRGTPVPLPPAAPSSAPLSAPLSTPPTIVPAHPPTASGAPEPTVWLLLITGFGLVGTIARTGRAARCAPGQPFRRH